MENSTELEMEPPNYTDPLNLTVAILLLVIGTFGVACNASIVYVFYKERAERHSFNLICVFRSLSNIYILSSTFLALFLPKTLLGYSPYSPPTECWLIHISNTLYMGNEYQIILVALNRFTAMFFPWYYQMIFSFGATLVVLLAIYIARVIVVIFETIPQNEMGCFTLYSVSSLAWLYDSTEKCKKEDNILAVIMATFIVSTAVNGFTLIKIIMFYKSNQNESKETQRRIRRNVFMFIQTMLQDSLYLIDLSFMIKFSQLSEARVWSFISGTLVWQCLHSIDGFIMIVFNVSVIKKHVATPSMSKVAPTKHTISAHSGMPEVA